MVEIIPKQIEKRPLWQEIIFYLSLLILIVVAASYIVLGNTLKNTYEELGKAKEDLTTAKNRSVEDLGLEKKIINYQKKINDFSKLITNYKQTSIFFDFIQNNTRPGVWFSKFILNSENSKATLSGGAENFQVVGQQLLIFKKNPLVKNINLSNISLAKKEGVEFTFDLFFKTDFLNYKLPKE